MSNSIEIQGVDTVPDSERTAKPSSIITIFVGSNLSLSVMVFGWLSILYGLSWWQSVSAILIGTLVASLFVSYSALLGWRAATNNSVASGAYFGVRGRLVASFVGLLLCIQYVALTVWTGGETLSAGWARISDSKESDTTVAIGFALIALAIVLFAILGYKWIITLNTWVGPLMAVLVVLSIIALWSAFDPAYAGDPELYALGTLTPTWLLAALTCGAAGPISFVTQSGDWSRYVSEKSYTSRDVVRSTFIAMFVGLSIPTLFGAFVAVAAFDEDSFASGFVANSPTWLLIPLLLIGFVGSLGQGSINLYSMGLDLDAILPKLSRMKSTALVAALSTTLVFVGKFIYDAEVAVTNSVLFLTCLATSWFAISIFGYYRSKGSVDKEALQMFNRRTTGGKYWFTSGWNFKAVIAWALGSAAGIFGISSVDYVGPIAQAVGDVDISIPTAAIVGLAVYALLERSLNR
jgi:purine-cytosine permease-like protein